jgi:hypothetical protein
MSQFQQAERSYAVTPSDATNFAQGVCESLWIGVGGTISYIPFDPANAAGGTAVATTVGAGLFPVRAKRVNATGTSASQIVAFY